MIKIGTKQYSLMIVYAIALHYLIGIALFTDPAAVNATGVAIFETLFDFAPVGIAMLSWVVASLALVSLLMPLGRWSIALMLPQQFMLMISAYGALTAMVIGQYGDGVERPKMFIMADQMPQILAAVFHTLAMIGRASEEPG